MYRNVSMAVSDTEMKQELKNAMLHYFNKNGSVSVLISGIDSVGYPRKLIKMLGEIWEKHIPMHLILIEVNGEHDDKGDPLDLIEKSDSIILTTSHLGFLETQSERLEHADIYPMGDLVRCVHAAALNMGTFSMDGDNEIFYPISADISLALCNSVLDNGTLAIKGTDYMSYDSIRASEKAFVEFPSVENESNEPYPGGQPPLTTVEPMFVYKAVEN